MSLGETGSSDPNINTNSSFDGDNGEDCGKVIINGNVKVYAYGGAGGCGGKSVQDNNSGTGGGGYYVSNFDSSTGAVGAIGGSGGLGMVRAYDGRSVRVV